MTQNTIENLTPSTKKNINLEKILNTINKLVLQHTILPRGVSYVIALWCVATYVIDDFRIFPRLLITSPERRCGKSTLLDLLQAFCFKSFFTSNMSTAVIYRLIDESHPTLIIDEADTFVANSSSEMTGIINSGHAKNRANVTRCNGDKHEVHSYSTWTPMVLAAIGDLQSTIMDRSLVIRMRRKTINESVVRIPHDIIKQNENIRRELLKWGKDNSKSLVKHPYIPTNLGNDRAVDNWICLFTIANLAGSTWLDNCKTAYQLLNVKEELALPTMLLSDIRIVFKTTPKLSSAKLISKLIEDQDKPWCEYKNGRPLTQASLATIIKPYGISPKVIRFESGTPRGYELKQFSDAFERYLPKP